MNRVIAVLTLAAASFAVACSPPVFPTPPSPSPQSSHAPSAVRVGAARIDITPPPGVSLFGHGPEGRVSDGYWSRLYCRAFVFVPSNASPLAVVTCDLSAIGMLLQRSVAEEVSRLDPGLLPTRIMLTATHTHAGPAHYLESTFFGDVLSTRAPGFDPNMVAFLSQRIAQAIHQATSHAVVAKLAWGHTGLWGVSRNRSLVPFLQNDPPFAPDPLCQVAGPLPSLPAERAVDPCLDVLRIEALDAAGADLGTIGVLAFFAMHPTVLPNTNRLLHADVDGVISRDVERGLRQDWLARDPAHASSHDPVAAIVNTNEGDMSPIWSDGTVEEAAQVGAKIASAILGTATLPTPGIVDARYVEMHLPDSPLFTGPRGQRRLCHEGQLGLAVAKGASDHLTALTLIGDFEDENVDFSVKPECSAPRRPVLGAFQGLVSGPGAFPEDVPLAVVQLGDTMISFVPAEMTATAGSRLAAGVREEALAYGLGAKRSLVAGLANAYIQYVTTEEEYRLQHYEGASDLYGKWTADWLTERYRLLARAMGGVNVSTWLPDIDRIHASSYALGSRRDRLPTPADGTPPNDVVRRPVSLCRLPDDAVKVCFRWHDGAPGVAFPVATDGAPWVRLAHTDPALSPVAVVGDPSGQVDDRGLWFRTRVHEREREGYSWSTVFAIDRGDWSTWLGAGTSARIVVGSGPALVVSSPFSDGAGVPWCAPPEVVFCNAER
jgi:neutral ceramidase